MISIMGANDLVMQGATASTNMILTILDRINPHPAR